MKTIVREAYHSSVNLKALCISLKLYSFRSYKGRDNVRCSAEPAFHVGDDRDAGGRHPGLASHAISGSAASRKLFARQPAKIVHQTLGKPVKISAFGQVQPNA